MTVDADEVCDFLISFWLFSTKTFAVLGGLADGKPESAGFLASTNDLWTYRISDFMNETAGITFQHQKRRRREVHRPRQHIVANNFLRAGFGHRIRSERKKTAKGNQLEYAEHSFSMSYCTCSFVRLCLFFGNMCLASFFFFAFSCADTPSLLRQQV